MTTKSLREMKLSEFWRERDCARERTLARIMVDAELARRGVRLKPAQNEGGGDA